MLAEFLRQEIVMCSFKRDDYLMGLFYIVYAKLLVEACRFNLWKMPRVFDRCYKIKMK